MAYRTHYTTPTSIPASSRGSSPTRPTRAIFWNYFCGQLNDAPTFSRRSSRWCRQGCRCRWRHRGMRAYARYGTLSLWSRCCVHHLCIVTSISANADGQRDAVSRKIDQIALPTEYNYQAKSVGRQQIASRPRNFSY